MTCEENLINEKNNYQAIYVDYVSKDVQLIYKVELRPYTPKHRDTWFHGQFSLSIIKSPPIRTFHKMIIAKIKEYSQLQSILYVRIDKTFFINPFLLFFWKGRRIFGYLWDQTILCPLPLIMEGLCFRLYLRDSHNGLSQHKDVSSWLFQTMSRYLHAFFHKYSGFQSMARICLSFHKASLEICLP